MARGISGAGLIGSVNADGDAAVREPADAATGWLLMAALLMSSALAAWLLPTSWRETIDWQPGRAWPEAWRAVTAVAVHYSSLHLAANLAGCLAVAALGRAARLPPRCTTAWALAWPLTQLGLLAQPALLHYGGLSGVLHAGVAVAGLHLAWRAAARRRAIGWALLVGLVVKVWSETPWGPPLRQVDGWDIAIAPAAHASGAIAGLLCAAAVEGWHQRHRSPGDLH